MKLFGRLLQVIGLVVLPLAMLLELSDFLGRPTGVSDMVIMMIFGCAAFWAGRIVEGYASP